MQLRAEGRPAGDGLRALEWLAAARRPARAGRAHHALATFCMWLKARGLEGSAVSTVGKRRAIEHSFVGVSVDLLLFQ